MDRVEVALTLLSIIIVVAPLSGIVYAYRDNLLGLVVPPEVRGLTRGDFTQSPFQPPMLEGKPQYNLETGQFTFCFRFTNPLENEISIDDISARLRCADHDVLLGDISIGKPIRIGVGESVIISASGSWTQEALKHFYEKHSGPEDDDIHVVFEDLNVEVAGIKLHMDRFVDGDWVPLPWGSAWS